MRGLLLYINQVGGNKKTSVWAKNYYNDCFLLEGGGTAPLLHHGGLGGTDRPLRLLLGGGPVPGEGPFPLPVMAEAEDGGDGGGAAADLGGRVTG